MKEKIARIAGIISFVFFAGFIACKEEEKVEPVIPEEQSTVVDQPAKTEEPADTDPETQVKDQPTYLIRAGQHYADQSSFSALNPDTLRFKVMFDSSAIYTTTDPANQGDINKLYGMSDCNSHHQVNSARFGWRWYKGKLEILGYTYKESVRSYALVDAVSLNAWHEYEIIFEANEYIFTLNGKTVKLPRSCSGKGSGYKLFPYFGGDEPAPHDVSIWIEDLP
jgi:hypothetical protein